ncbi:NUDIX domain-containing protein [Croceiramulus getboli]
MGDCVAYRSGTIDQLPVKRGKTKVTTQFFNYLVLVDPAGQTLFQQRSGKGIWQGLFEFPLIISEDEVDVTRFRESEPVQQILAQTQVKDWSRYNESPIIHKLSHRELKVTFWIVKVDALPALEGVQTDDPTALAVPVVIARFIDAFDF